MPSSALVDVAIGLAFIYLFFSLVCSVVNEGIAVFFSLRSNNLVDGVESLFSKSHVDGNGTTFVEAIYNHGLIRGLFKDPPAGQPITGTAQQIKKDFKKILPAYIPSQTFALALFDVVAPATAPAGGAPPPSTFERLNQIKTSIAALPDSTARTALMSLAASAGGDLSKLQKSVESWFNDSMDRAASWYKRRAQRILLLLGLAVALGLNVDSIRVAETLWNSPAARQATAALAEQYAKNHQTNMGSQAELKQQAKDLSDLGSKLPIPFGWGKDQKDNAKAVWEGMGQFSLPEWFTLFVVLEKLAGWIITALALSLGAPFWFDTLNKFMAVRTSIKPKEEPA